MTKLLCLILMEQLQSPMFWVIFCQLLARTGLSQESLSCLLRYKRMATKCCIYPPELLVIFGLKQSGHVHVYIDLLVTFFHLRYEDINKLYFLND